MGPFRLEALRYAPGARIPPFAHEDFNFCLVLAGGCVERREGCTHRYQGPALTVNVPTTSQEFEIGPEGVDCFSVDVDPSWMAALEGVEGDGGRGLSSPEPAVNVTDPGRVAAALRLREAAVGDDLRPLALEERLLEILPDPGGPNREAPGPAPAWLRRIRERLEDDPSAAPSLAGLARDAGVHRVHLARTFRRFFGRTVGEHLRRLRLRRAQVEIAHGDTALGRIALRAGFYDQSHFNRHFKRITGMTPGRFRELARLD